MKKFSLQFYICIFVFNLLFSQLLFSQTENKQWLRNFAEEQSALWHKERAEAESLAAILKIPVWFEYSDRTVIELQKFEYGLPVYHSTENLNAARTVSTDKVWNTGMSGFNLSGSGQVLGLWEAGGYPLHNHQELVGRMTQMDAGSSVTQHATHVAGTMIASGVNQSATGMSNAGNLNYYNSSNDLSEVAAAAAAGLKVTNHSYGAIRGWRFNYFNDNKWAWFGNPAISEVEDWQFGFYSGTSASWDNMLYNAPYILVVKSAGNDRGDGPQPGAEHWVNINGNWQLSTTVREIDGGADGYECINDPRGIAKNTLAIGAVNDIPGGYTNPSDVVMSSFSNWGPTDDGRIKPDVVANGVSLTSSSNGSTVSYANLSGTSMSSPNVSGSVGLLLEHQQQLFGAGNPLRGSTIKALIIHTADEAGSFPGPDYVFGWGLLNTLNSVKVMQLNSDVGNDLLIKEETLNNGGLFEYQVQSNGSEPLRVTISWTDPPGTPPAASLNPPDIMLVNDLDLRVIGPGGTLMPWILNPANPSDPAGTGDNIRDNTEQVFIENPIAGAYSIQVNHKGTLTGGSQVFSLIVTGIDMPVPEQVSLIYPPDGSVSLEINPVMEWNGSIRSFNYQLQIAEDSLFNSPVVDFILPGLTYQPTQLLGMKTYYWRVRGVNSGGGGDWSDIWMFDTELVVPNAPILHYPEDFAENILLDVEFVWISSHTAENYQLQVANNAIFTSLVFSDSTLTDTSFTVTDLSDGSLFYWRVRGKNSLGFGEYSHRNRFTTLLPAPTNLTAVYSASNAVELSWNDNSQNESKYFIQRKTGVQSFATIDSVGANQQSYTDMSVVQATEYTYRVFCSNNNAVSGFSNEVNILTVVSVGNETTGIPDNYELFANYPNPFNPSTQIKYALPEESKVKLVVYNILGETIAELVNDINDAGYYSVIFDSNGLSSGIYFYALEAGSVNTEKSFYATGKMILLK